MKGETRTTRLKIRFRYGCFRTSIDRPKLPYSRRMRRPMHPHARANGNAHLQTSIASKGRPYTLPSCCSTLRIPSGNHHVYNVHDALTNIRPFASSLYFCLSIQSDDNSRGQRSSRVEPHARSLSARGTRYRPVFDS